MLLLPLFLGAQTKTYNFHKGNVKISWNDRDVTGERFKHPGTVFNLYELGLDKNVTATHTTADTSVTLNMTESKMFFVTAQNDFDESGHSDTILVNISDIPENAIQVPFSLSGIDLPDRIEIKGVWVITADNKLGLWGMVKEVTATVPIYIPDTGDYVIAITGAGKVDMILAGETSILTLNRDTHRIERHLETGAYNLVLHTVYQFVLSNLEIRLKAGEAPGVPDGIGAAQAR